MLGCNRHIVEEAEPHRAIGLRVVTGRADEGEGVARSTVEYGIDRIDCCARGQIGRVDAGGRGHGVGVEAKVSASCRFDTFDVRGSVHTQDGFGRRGRGSLQPRAGDRMLAEHRHNRVHACGPLGVSRARVMLAHRRVVQQQRVGHDRKPDTPAGSTRAAGRGDLRRARAREGSSYATPRFFRELLRRVRTRTVQLGLDRAMRRWVVTLSLGFLAACGEPPREEEQTSGAGISASATAGLDTDGPSDTSDGPGETGDDGIKLDIPAPDTGEDPDGPGAGTCPPLPGTDATLTGTVYAPNQEIPVSGALVYVADTPPDGIPQTVYCAECVELPCDIPFTLTEPDGSFELPAYAGAGYLVVRKGQFMRVTDISIDEGVNAFGAEITSLPAENAPNDGRYIPRIALAWGAYDRLEDALGKLGLADTMIDGANFEQDFVPGTEQFDVWNNSTDLFGGGPETDSLGSFAQLLSSYPLMEQYHIIFVPCSDDTALSALDDPAVIENIRRWVDNGGKFYVSDWSNEFVARVFGQYQAFYTDSGSADLPNAYSSTATVLDDDLTAWLEALPPGLKDINPLNGAGASYPTVNAPPTIETVDNWSGIESTPPVLVDDGMGGQIDVGHKVWIEGPGDADIIPGGNHPLTVTGQYGCGKVLFTTYHMAEFTNSYVGLTPQELVLLYLILEIGVCQIPFDPPPPAG